MSKDKKGEILNQLALISDLLEKVNLKSENRTVFYEMDEDEYDRVYEYIKSKGDGEGIDEDSKTFTILIGDVSFMFSKNNV